MEPSTQTIGSPANVSALLNCYCFRDRPDYETVMKSANGIEMLIAKGAICPDGDWYKTTPLGEAWVKAICNVPVPAAKFVDEMGRVIS